MSENDRLRVFEFKNWKDGVCAPSDILRVTIRTLSPDMEESGYVRKVEMLDTESEQWYTLASLPQASTDLSISLCSRNLYLLGGWSSKDRTKTMITCHL